METLTFLFTDIEGSTALLQRTGESAYAQILADHHSLIRSALAAHDGRELNTMGDGFFAAFPSARECAAAVLAMQQALETHAWPGAEQVRVRMGVHTGEAARGAATGVLGLDVHRAARVAAVAYGGQILLSETAASLMRDSLPAGAALRDLGLHRLKDLGRPEHIYQLGSDGLQADFPPLHSLGNPDLPNNLPQQLSTFIGRSREVAEVRAMVGSSRLVTLTGAGGSGKTRLSLQVAAELLDGSEDGVWLAELAGVTDENAVAPVICAALGIRVQPGRPVHDALVDALMPQRILLVLDNCEHLIDACAKTAETILRRCPKVHLLATSREPLGIGGEVIYQVPSLSLPVVDEPDDLAVESWDSVALFVDRAREQGVDVPVTKETGPLIVSICRRLDGMPLAIELAAARLRSLSLGQLRDRLDQRFRLLTGGSRTALERQQTLRATVDWSYSLLTAAEQRLLQRLSALTESFDLGAAEAVCGFGDIEMLEVADLLGSLVDKSLVLAEQAGGDVRFRLLETIRQYAAERLLETGGSEASAVAAAHCAHFLALAEAVAVHLTGAEQGKWLARLDDDAANLRRAAEHAAGDPDGTTRVLRFGVALRRYWMTRSQEADACVLLLPVLDRPGADADPELYGAALVTATIAGRTVDLETGRRLGERAAEHARRVGDERVLIESLSALCSNHYFAGEAEKGLPFGEEAVARARRFGDDGLLGGGLMGYLLCADLIDPAKAEQLYVEAIACTERSGDRFIGYLLHNNAGVHALRAGDMPAARAHLEEAAAYMAELGETSHHVLVNLGWVLWQERDLAGARSMFEKGLWLSRRSGERAGIPYACLGLACVAADLGDWDRAADLLGAAEALVDQTGEPWQDPEARYRQETLDVVRAHLGAQQFKRAYARGATLSSDDAYDLARGRRLAA